MSAPDGQLPSQTSNPDSLNGWKEIAQYLGRAVRTVQRWEHEYGLPVHRVQAAKDEVLWASRAELDQWKANRIDVEAPSADAPPVESGPPVGAQARYRRMTFVTTVAVLSLMALAVVAWRSRQAPLLLRSEGAPTRAQGETIPLAVTGFASGGAVTRWTRVPNGNVEALGDPIRAADDGRMAWSLTTDCATETGTHRLWMVDDQTGQRSNEVEVVVLANPSCDQPTPDLAVRAVVVDRASIAPGQSIRVTYAVWNLGNALAVATTTRLRLGAESTRSRVTDLALADHPAPQLTVGEQISQSVDVRIPEITAPGVYYIWVVADNLGATIESSSFNNFARSNALVVTAQP